LNDGRRGHLRVWELTTPSGDHHREDRLVISSLLLTIRELRKDDLSPAVAVIARAMRDNPQSLAAFGSNPMQRLSRLQGMFGEWYVGYSSIGAALSAPVG
jgi:hypothetical protein